MYDLCCQRSPGGKLSEKKVQFSLAPEAKGNPKPMCKVVLLLPQLQMLHQAQKGGGARHGKGQAFNLTEEQVETAEDVATSIICWPKIPSL